jgi:ppGpp synthetase/RelA/SpoT-type nucleotidyltranferase
MEWTTPQFKRGEVDWAGRALVRQMRADQVDWSEWAKCHEIINNWRSAHAFPLNILQDGLRKKARRFDANVVVAQRTKRLWSIWHKLERFETMQLSQMQDIGGCRAIFTNSAQVEALLNNYKQRPVKHIQKRITNYITSPKPSGYRGIHVIWEYKGSKESFNGLKIEMQIRSVIQHAWATTVETIGTLTRQALKSSIGEGDWLRFFALMGATMALQERSEPVPGTPTDPNELITELREYASRVNAVIRLRTIGDALQKLEQPSAIEEGAHFFLLELDSDQLRVRGFRANQQVEAQNQYIEAEKLISGNENKDAVLVSVDSLASLRRAFPNYFLDTKVFATLLDAALEGNFVEMSLSDM